MALSCGVGFWMRMRTLADVGRPIATFEPDLDNSEVVVTYTNGPNNTYTFAQVATWLTANAGVGTVTEQDVVDGIDAALRNWGLQDGTPPPEGGWTTETMPGRGGRK